MQNHDHALLALFGLLSLLGYLVHRQRQHVARKTARRRGER